MCISCWFLISYYFKDQIFQLVPQNMPPHRSPMMLVAWRPSDLASWFNFVFPLSLLNFQLGLYFAALHGASLCRTFHAHGFVSKLGVLLVLLQMAMITGKTYATNIHTPSKVIKIWNPRFQIVRRIHDLTIFQPKITLLRVIPTMTFQNSLLTPLLSEAFVTGLLPN